MPDELLNKNTPVINKKNELIKLNRLLFTTHLNLAAKF